MTTCALAAAVAAVAVAAPTTATVLLSSSRPGAQHVAVTVRVPSALRCGYALGSVEIGLPAAERVPRAIAPTAVTVNGNAAGKVTVSGHDVTVDAARPGGVICDSIVLGTMAVQFSPSAALANPARAGAYAVRIARGGTRYSATVRIR